MTDPYQNYPPEQPDPNKPPYQSYPSPVPPPYPSPAPQQQPPGQPAPPPYPPQPQPQGYPPPAYPGYPGYADPEAPYGRDFNGVPLSDKSKMVAGILEIFLGGFGAGRFYTGHTGIAVAQIAVTWLTCGIGGIWPLIDGIMMLAGNVTDSWGRPLRE